MIVLTDIQGSEEWLHSRLGVITASNMHRVITKTGKPSASADRYLAQLAAEWFLDSQIDDADSGFMERGNDMEQEARAAYEFVHDVTVEKCGLCLRDDRKVGASPDGLVGSAGLVEIKVPSAVVMMMYVLEGPPSDYFVQIQGQLLVTGRDWCDLHLWNPSIPTVTKRYARDEEFIAALAVEVNKLVARLDAAKELLAQAKADYDATREAMAGDVPAELST